MKKALKVALFVLLGLIAAAYFVLYFGYNRYRPSRVQYEVLPAALNYFHETYEDCRAAFLKKAAQLAQQYNGVEVLGIPLPGITDSNLIIDCCYIPAQGNSHSLLILSSGVHGIEGFTGSAVQLMVMQELLTPGHLGSMGVLLIHGLNPYGFKYSRRVTENNVDLNRNCAIEESLFDTHSEGYGKLNDMLNSEGTANDRNLRNRHFHLIVARKILNESMRVLRQAILQGQYEYPEGVYFGGKKIEPQIIALTPILQEKLIPYSRILTIDLHTGFGKNGTMHLFPNPVEDAVIKTGMEELFSGYPIDWGDSQDFYTILGSFVDYVGSLAPGKTYYPMAFEFGTLDSQKTFGSIRSLHNMILENQGFRHGYKNKKTEAKIKEDFLEMFYPSDNAWRSKVIGDAKCILELVLERLGKG
jgi:hypothetical protein